MTRENLNEILQKHQKWMDGEDDGKRADLRSADLRGADLCGAGLCSADLRSADLRSADLRGVDLCGADLRSADLCGADLRGADIDYACWPLWRKSLHVHICDRLAKQLLYHVVSIIRYSKHVSVQAKQVVLTRDIIDLANEFHRAEECGKIEYWSKEDAVI